MSIKPYMKYEELKNTDFYELLSNSAKIRFAMYFLDPSSEGITQDSLEEDLMDLEMEGEKVEILDRLEIEAGLRELLNQHLIGRRIYSQNEEVVKEYFLESESREKLENIVTKFIVRGLLKYK